MAHGHVQQVPPTMAPRPERRAHERLATDIDANLHLHGREQRIIIHDISHTGMKLKEAFGLMPGDDVTIELLSHREFNGTVVWVVAPYTGIAFDRPLAETDPVFA